MAGALVSGLLYESYGAVIMFRVNSLIAVIAAVLYYIVGILMERCVDSSMFITFVIDVCNYGLCCLNWVWPQGSKKVKIQ